ncbi:MAG TPA: hypothetical protein VNT42_09565 [Sphingomonas sp.]|nr:hypothetical protein [Sphingomonas sp.]
MPGRDEDEIYYRMREREARAMAERATDPHIKSIHLRFAEAYARRARAEANRTQAA